MRMVRRLQASLGVRLPEQGARHAAVPLPLMPRCISTCALPSKPRRLHRSRGRSDPEAAQQEPDSSPELPTIPSVHRLRRNRHPHAAIRPPRSGDKAHGSRASDRSQTMVGRRGRNREVRRPLRELSSQANGVPARMASRGLALAGRRSPRAIGNSVIQPQMHRLRRHPTDRGVRFPRPQTGPTPESLPLLHAGVCPRALQEQQDARPHRWAEAALQPPGLESGDKRLSRGTSVCRLW